METLHVLISKAVRLAKHFHVFSNGCYPLVAFAHRVLAQQCLSNKTHPHISGINLISNIWDDDYLLLILWNDNCDGVYTVFTSYIMNTIVLIYNILNIFQSITVNKVKIFE